ncbi:hypothetical protein DBR40_21710 [Pedobacter sp. KBW01]|uniref:hypothetical protein n=1 Tax=Pedobacter sp. KBW01 TaxID=2153364 RepID=UPI000F5B2E63|nr:hypothetical protein [Pedobacter sp. KBW01]RQO66871.1 hypothetical protein DBR40_21710 [Pedobacter sp. KBW01]
MKHGMSQHCQVILVNSIYDPENKRDRHFEILNQICIAVYFLSLLGACLSFFFYKGNKIKKYKIGIVLFADPIRTEIGH